MEEKFKNKYCTKSSRLKGWDYSTNAYYFITICTNDKKHFFGKVNEDKVVLSKLGKIAENFWREIPQHFLFTVLDAYIIMPNHVHGIIGICNKVDFCRDEAMPRLYGGDKSFMSKISPKSGSLSVIVGSYKSIVSKTINKQYPHLNFSWQPRFYDRIIRTDSELEKARNYIINNPFKWNMERDNI